MRFKCIVSIVLQLRRMIELNEEVVQVVPWVSMGETFGV